MKRILVSAAIAAGAFALISGAALAAYSLFGDAEIVSPGAGGSPHAVEADGTTTGSSIEFTVPDGTTFEDLEELSTDFRFEAGDCTAGSPRFQIAVQNPNDPDEEWNIFVYIGPPPAYTPCAAPGYANTGDLLEGVNPVDTSQCPGPCGTFYDPYPGAVAAFGDYLIQGVSLVVDPGYGQIVRFDNTVVGEDLYTYDQPADKDECKNGGWEDLTREDGSTFKNQGDCIQYVNTGR